MTGDDFNQIISIIMCYIDKHIILFVPKQTAPDIVLRLVYNKYESCKWWNIFTCPRQYPNMKLKGIHSQSSIKKWAGIFWINGPINILIFQNLFTMDTTLHWQQASFTCIFWLFLAIFLCPCVLASTVL